MTPRRPTCCEEVGDPDWQIRTARRHGARVIELDSGHSPFLTQPNELAEMLSSLA